MRPRDPAHFGVRSGLQERVRVVLAHYESWKRPVSYSDVARELHVSSSAVRKAVEALKAAGLVVRLYEPTGGAYYRVKAPPREVARGQMRTSVLPDSGFVRPLSKAELMAGRAPTSGPGNRYGEA